MDSLPWILRVTARALLRSRSFAIAAVLTIGVAIGATTAIFSVVDAVLLRPLPYPGADELVTLRLEVDSDATDELPFSDRAFRHFHEENRSFERLGGYMTARFPLVGEGDPIQVNVTMMTAEAFETLGVAPSRGRFPTAEEDVPNGPLLALISAGLWAERFGGDPGIVGRILDLNGRTHEVIGVMPPSYDFPSPQADLWIPFQLNPESENSGGHYIEVVARLRDGVSADAAAEEASSLIRRFEEVGYGPEWVNNVFTGRARITSVEDGIVGGSRRPLLVVLGTVGFLLLIACGNVANLLLVRTESRSRETAVRAALGASRWRLAREVLFESVALAIAGGLLGVFLAYGGTRILVAIGPATIPRLDEIRASGTVLAFTAAVVIGAGFLVGLLPALRVASGRSHGALRDGGRSTTAGRDRHRARGFLVAAQVALTLVLLVGSGLMVRSFQQLRAIDPGFRPEGVLTFGLSLPPNRYPGPEPPARFMERLLEQLEAIPGVASAGGTTALPLTGARGYLVTEIEGFPVAPGDFPPAFPIRRVTPGYFETMGISLVDGRVFDARDHDQRLGTAVVSASLREEYWPASSALGNRLWPSRASVEIVGEVGGVHDGALTSPADQIVYLPMLGPRGGARVWNVVVRTDDPLRTMPAIRREIARIDPLLPITDVRTMSDIVGESIGRVTFTMSLLVLSSLVALFLGSIGIFGVVSYVVTQRTAEMGIRQALGAAPQQVLGLVMRQAMAVVVAGVVVGLVAAVWLGGTLSALVYGIDPFDRISFVTGAIVFLVVATTAALIPALRAARIEPAEALRRE